MTIFIIALVLVVGTIFFFIKSGKIEDKDGNNIPDVIDEKVKKVKEVVEETKFRAERVSEEIADVVEAVKEAVEQSKDVVDAAKGKKRKGKKPTKK
jgi:Asp-tRNA(Asn)/Glu-tRNA(Gln) amidotransferase B subunit